MSRTISAEMYSKLSSLLMFPTKALCQKTQQTGKFAVHSFENRCNPVELFCVLPPRITMEDKYANPWRTLSSRQVYDNPWISVREDEVVRPDGRPGIYGV